MSSRASLRSSGVWPAVRVEALEQRSLLSAPPAGGDLELSPGRELYVPPLLVIPTTPPAADEPAGTGDVSVTFKGKPVIRRGRGYSFKLVFQSAQPIDPATLAPATVVLAEADHIVRSTTAKKTRVSQDGRRVTVSYYADFIGVSTSYSGTYDVRWPASDESGVVGNVTVRSRYPYSVYGGGGAFQGGGSFYNARFSSLTTLV